MFNRTTYVDAGYRGPSTVNITEKRAPTDESVRLLKEMEEAALNKIVESTIVKNTSFECKVFKNRNYYLIQDTYHVVYSLNGHKLTTTVHMEVDEKPDPYIIAEEIRNAVAIDIANQLLKTGFVEAFRNGFK